ncbi:hypothetical protein pb186bvf_006150 [Paramecium bursaria]
MQQSNYEHSRNLGSILSDDDDRTRHLGSIFDSHLQSVFKSEIVPNWINESEIKNVQNIQTDYESFTDDLLDQIHNQDVILQECKKIELEIKNDEEIVYRDYQLDIFDKAKDQNSIIYLETGMGKTLIMIMVMWQKLKKNPNKRVLFLANTIQLVEQQAAQIKIKLPKVARIDLDYEKDQEYIAIQAVEKICILHGRKYGDLVQRTGLRFMVENNKIFVMTTQLFLNALRRGLVRLDEFSLICFDECHATQSDHPYNLIMKEFYFPLKKDLEEQKILKEMPQLIGSTASPVMNNKANTPKDILQEILGLAANMDSMYVYSDQESQQKYLNNAQIKFVKYQVLNNNDLLLQALEQQFASKNNEIVQYIESINFMPEYFILREELNQFRSRYKEKRIQQAIWEIQDLILVKGLFLILDQGRYTIIILLNIAINGLKTYVSNNQRSPYKNQISQLQEQLTKFLDRCKLQYGDIKKFCSNKVQELLICLDYIFNLDKNNLTLIFVKQRITAAYLCEYLRQYYQGSDINIDYIIGIRGIKEQQKKQETKTVQIDVDETLDEEQNTALIDSLLTNFSSYKSLDSEEVQEKFEKILMIKNSINRGDQSKVIDAFRKQKLQILITTSVAEEGIDIPMCNYVICYNSITNSKAYVQMKGRARKENSQFIIMVPQINQQSKVQQHQAVQLTTKQQIKDISQPIRKQKVLDTIKVIQQKQKNQEYEFFLIQESGANINMNWSINLVQDFCQQFQEGYNKINPQYVVFQLRTEKLGANTEYIAFLQLPFVLKEFLFYSKKCSTPDLAKAHVALKAAKSLYLNGYITSDLQANNFQGIGIHFGADEDDYNIDMTSIQREIFTENVKKVIRQSNLLNQDIKVFQRLYKQNRNQILKTLSHQDSNEYISRELTLNNNPYYMIYPVNYAFDKYEEFFSLVGIKFTNRSTKLGIQEFEQYLRNYKQQIIQELNFINPESNFSVFKQANKPQSYNFTNTNEVFFISNGAGGLGQIYSSFIFCTNAYDCYNLLRKKQEQNYLQNLNQTNQAQIQKNSILDRIDSFKQHLTVFKKIYENRNQSEIFINMSIVEVDKQPSPDIKQYMREMVIECLNLRNFNSTRHLIGCSYFKFLLATQIYRECFQLDAKQLISKSKLCMSATKIRNNLLENKFFQFIFKKDSNPIISLFTKISIVQENITQIGSFQQQVQKIEQHGSVKYNTPYYNHISNQDFVKFLYQMFAYVYQQKDDDFKNGYYLLEQTKALQLKSYLKNKQELAEILPQQNEEEDLAFIRKEYTKLEKIISYQFTKFELLFQAMTDISFRNVINNSLVPNYLYPFLRRNNKNQDQLDYIDDPEIQSFISGLDKINEIDFVSYDNQGLGYLGNYLWKHLITIYLVKQNFDQTKTFILKKLLTSFRFQACLAIKLKLNFFLNYNNVKSVQQIYETSSPNSSLKYQLEQLDQWQLTQGLELLGNAYRALVAAMYLDSGCNNNIYQWVDVILSSINTQTLFEDQYLLSIPRYAILKWYSDKKLGDPINFDLIRIPHNDYKKVSKNEFLFVPYDLEKSEIGKIQQYRVIINICIYETSSMDETKKTAAPRVQFKRYSK